MTAGGFLCYTKDVFCLFLSLETRRNAEGRGAQYERDKKRKCERTSVACAMRFFASIGESPQTCSESTRNSKVVAKSKGLFRLKQAF